MHLKLHMIHMLYNDLVLADVVVHAPREMSVLHCPGSVHFGHKSASLLPRAPSMDLSDDEDFFACASQAEDEGMLSWEYESSEASDEDMDAFSHEAMSYCEEPRAPLLQTIFTSSSA